MIKKNKKRVKLIPLPKLRKKLFKLWSDAVRSSSNYTCEFCGIKKDQKLENGRVGKIDAHHLLNRYINNSPLKFDVRNSIALCAFHHRFCCESSAHKAPIKFYEWLRLNKPDKHRFVLEHIDSRVNLNNRTVLEYIHSCLVNKELLDYDILKQMV